MQCKNNNASVYRYTDNNFLKVFPAIYNAYRVTNIDTEMISMFHDNTKLCRFYFTKIDTLSTVRPCKIHAIVPNVWLVACTRDFDAYAIGTMEIESFT